MNTTTTENEKKFVSIGYELLPERKIEQPRIDCIFSHTPIVGNENEWCDIRDGHRCIQVNTSSEYDFFLSLQFRKQYFTCHSACGWNISNIEYMVMATFVIWATHVSLQCPPCRRKTDDIDSDWWTHCNESTELSSRQQSVALKTMRMYIQHWHRASIRTIACELW